MSKVVANMQNANSACDAAEMAIKRLNDFMALLNEPNSAKHSVDMGH